jgi:hypothetical protein
MVGYYLRREAVRSYEIGVHVVQIQSDPVP